MLFKPPRKWKLHEAEPDELWEAERFIAAKDLVVWVGKVPTARWIRDRLESALGEGTVDRVRHQLRIRLYYDPAPRN